MKKQKGFTLLDLLIVVAIIGILAALAIPAAARASFTGYFGFKPEPKTVLKRELIRDHLANIGRACGEAVRREEEFNTHQIRLSPLEAITWENLRMESSNLRKQTDALCTLHARVVFRAKDFGYVPDNTQ